MSRASLLRVVVYYCEIAQNYRLYDRIGSKKGLCRMSGKMFFVVSGQCFFLFIVICLGYTWLANAGIIKV